MGRENVTADTGFRALVTSLRQALLDRFSIGLLSGGIAAFVVAVPTTHAWLWVVSATPIIAWRFRQSGATRSVASRQQHDLYGNQTLLEIAGKTAKLGGWVVHLPDRKLQWSDETWAIHERTKNETMTFEEGIGYLAPEWQGHSTLRFVRRDRPALRRRGGDHHRRRPAEMGPRHRSGDPR